MGGTSAEISSPQCSRFMEGAISCLATCPNVTCRPEICHPEIYHPEICHSATHLGTCPATQHTPSLRAASSRTARPTAMLLGAAHSTADKSFTRERDAPPPRFDDRRYISPGRHAEAHRKRISMLETFASRPAPPWRGPPRLADEASDSDDDRHGACIVPAVQAL